eukprot:SAG22_NODE_942_length_6401_cov_9.094000_4_plen_243_part_00
MPVFRGLQEEVIQKLSLAMKRVLAMKDDIIVEENTVGREMYVIERGEVVLSRYDTYLGTLSNGNFFGFEGLLPGRQVRAAYCWPNSPHASHVTVHIADMDCGCCPAGRSGSTRRRRPRTASSASWCVHYGATRTTHQEAELRPGPQCTPPSRLQKAQSLLAVHVCKIILGPRCVCVQSKSDCQILSQEHPELVARLESFADRRARMEVRLAVDTVVLMNPLWILLWQLKWVSATCNDSIVHA